MHAFEHQDSRQTLAQGIEEYFAANPGLTKGRRMSAEAEHFFRCHDATHVIFGCGTTLDDEAAVKIASIFGTTAGFNVLKGYRLHESLDIYKQLRVADVLLSVAHSVVVVPRTIVLLCSACTLALGRLSAVPSRSAARSSAAVWYQGGAQQCHQERCLTLHSSP